MTYVKVKLSPLGSKKNAPVYEADFLVDSGAEDSLVPGSALQTIGIDPEDEDEYELADGTLHVFPYGSRPSKSSGGASVGTSPSVQKGSNPSSG